MTRNEYRAAALDVLYLAGCAVNGTAPDKKRVEAMDIEALFSVAKSHTMTAITAYSLRKAGLREHEFTQELGKSLQKITLLETEKNRLFRFMEEHGIRHTALKGAVLKDLYPAMGLRQMSDYDILFDPAFRREVRNYMISAGFTVDSYEHAVDDAYSKPPSTHIELHTALFSESHYPETHRYFADIWSRMVPAPGTTCEFIMTDEDFYIYMTAHEYKHFSNGGTGVRSLLDSYVFRKKKAGTLDTKYITRELAALGLTEFEEDNSFVADKLFSGEKLNEVEQEFLDYFIFSGTYGTHWNRVRNITEKKGTLGFILGRIFLPMSTIKESYPFYYKHRILLPVLFFKRVFRGLTTGRQLIINEAKFLIFKHRSTKKKKKQQSSR